MPLITTQSAKGYGWGSLVSGGGTAFESIATATIASATSTVTITSIPSTYKHLQIRGIGRQTDGSGQSSFAMNFNGNGTGYSWHYIFGNGSTVAAGQSNGDGFYREINFINASGTQSNTFNGFVIDILDYANTNKGKTLKSLGGCSYGSGGGSHLQSGFWSNTSAVTSITFTTVAANFEANTQFALYGIKG
jgi:hypothetical protein